MAILTVPISFTLSTYSRFYELRNASGLWLFACMIMRPVPVPQAIASRKEMKLAVKVSQYLFSPVKVVRLEYLV